MVKSDFYYVLTSIQVFILINLLQNVNAYMSMFQGGEGKYSSEVLMRGGGCICFFKP